LEGALKDEDLPPITRYLLRRIFRNGGEATEAEINGFRRDFRDAEWALGLGPCDPLAPDEQVRVDAAIFEAFEKDRRAR